MSTPPPSTDDTEPGGRVGGVADLVLTEEFNWAARPHRELYDGVHLDNDPGQAASLAEEWQRLGADMTDSATAFADAIRATEDGWQGEAATIARQATLGLATWSGETSTAAQTMAGIVGGQGALAEQARSAMPEPVEFDWDAMLADGFATGGMPGFTSALADVQALNEQSRQAHEQAVTVMADLETHSRDLDARTPLFDLPPEVVSGARAQATSPSGFSSPPPSTDGAQALLGRQASGPGSGVPGVAGGAQTPAAMAFPPPPPPAGTGAQYAPPPAAHHQPGSGSTTPSGYTPPQPSGQFPQPDRQPPRYPVPPNPGLPPGYPGYPQGGPRPGGPGPARPPIQGPRPGTQPGAQQPGRPPGPPPGGGPGGPRPPMPSYGGPGGGAGGPGGSGGGSGGGFGNANAPSRGFGPTGSAPGPGGFSGAQPGVPGGHADHGPTPGRGPAGGAGAPGGMAGGGGGGAGGRGEEDKEHRSAGYLKGESIFDDDDRIAPPVIGASFKKKNQDQP